MNNKNINNSHFPKILLSLSLIFFFLLSFGNVFATPSISVDLLTTNDQTPELTGTYSVEEGISVTRIVIEVNDSSYDLTGNIGSKLNGVWTLNDNQLTTLSEGIYEVLATMTANSNDYYDSTSNELIIDTTAPTVSITLSDSALIVGETSVVTFTFSEAPTDFTVADVTTIDNGTLSNFAVNGGDSKIYTATFTPTDDLEDSENIITVGTEWTDAAGNSPTATTDSSNYEIDTKEPTLSITLSDYALIVGETSVVTFTFSEAPTDFTVADVTTIDNGNLSDFAVNSGDSKIYTATFTPTDDLEDSENIITVGTSWTDAAGNSPVGTTDSSNYVIDTKEPVISQVTAVTTPTNNSTPNYTFTTSEVGSMSFTGGCSTLNTISGTGNATIAFTALSDGTYDCNLIVTDTAGNESNILEISEFTIDATSPTYEILYSNNGPVKLGTGVTITAEFSEDVKDSSVPQIALSGD
ncbi:MAG: Ig-like domain-containing protein, partial [Candidatus ainarchaeum sp.]|nr:Ig-like domain-containing protein [Candidatus ainarchaeum sp.]